jgi:hypothetical protein
MSISFGELGLSTEVFCSEAVVAEKYLGSPNNSINFPRYEVRLLSNKYVLLFVIGILTNM